MRRSALVVLASLVACSSASNSANPGGDAGSDVAVNDTNVVETSGTAPCSESPSDIPPGSLCVLSVSGKVVDEKGNPVVDKSISVCGTVCFYSKTDATGAFVTQVGAHIVSIKYAVNVHGRPDYATTMERLPAGLTGDFTASAPYVAVTLPATGAALPADGSAGGSVADGDVTLSVPSATKFALDPDDIELGAAGRLFRAVAMPASLTPTWAIGAGLTQLYALTPFTATPTNKLDVTLANTSGLAAGSAVELVRVGSTYFGIKADAGALVVVGTGTVSSDGKTITSDTGQGLDELTFLGVRPKS
jgi:hypothetical protein